ncbi:MAG: hypothetical protein LBD04_03250, partial [Synergistaceae bacterium]|nr:hypothetical protein [Synergistaceae bacterium]
MTKFHNAAIKGIPSQGISFRIGVLQMLNLYDIFTKIRDITLENSTLEAARLKSTFFTRNRKMSFPQILLFILKGINTSTQSALNRFFRIDPADGSSINQQALSKARSHFDHSPFEKMFRAVVEMRYCGEHAVRLRCGCRVPAVDGSAVALPGMPKLL